MLTKSPWPHTLQAGSAITPSSKRTSLHHGKKQAMQFGAYRNHAGFVSGVLSDFWAGFDRLFCILLLSYCSFWLLIAPNNFHYPGRLGTLTVSS